MATTKKNESLKEGTMKIKGVKDPVEITRTVDTGKMLHHYFEHPDTGKETRVIKRK